MQDNKVEYKKLCEQEKNIPIFMQPWWLDAVCTEGVGWNVTLAHSAHGEIVAAMAFCIKKKWGISMITTPHLTQFTGIWFKEKGKINQRTEQLYLKQIIAQLPHFQHFILRFNYLITDWLPFYWAGFQQTTRYTYIIPDTTHLDAVFNIFDSNTKREIRQASAKYTIEESSDFDLFLKLKHPKDNTPLSIWQSLDTILTEKECKKIYFARNTEKNTIDATAYIIWDKNSTYYLASGSTEAGRKNHAMHLLIWKAIQDSAQCTPIFDFEGSMLETVEPFFRRFGAVQKPYFQISKFNNRLLQWAFMLLKK
jgi:hypothetical protein